ncbi:phosphotransferase [Nonomuraea ferruginea]
MAVLEILDRIPLLSGVPRSVEELPGGLTNRNFKVTTDGGTFVVRVFGGDGSLLFIDRDAEHLATLAAAEAGVGAPVHAYLPGEGLVVGYIPGRTFTEADVRDPANLPRLAETCRRLHAGPRFPREFDMFDVQRRYLGIVRERGFRLLRRGIWSSCPRSLKSRNVWKCGGKRRFRVTTTCWLGNIIGDGQRLWLIDYEYAGNNDPCFELGNLWSESDLSPGQLEELVTAYYGRRLRHKIARARLLGLMAKYGWTLWASIQDGADQPIDFDFWSWGGDGEVRAGGGRVHRRGASVPHGRGGAGRLEPCSPL